MARLLQLPRLYGLRGSIATQTMANLSEEEKALVAEVVERVANSSRLQQHRCKFRLQLANTIGGDYNEVAAADQEFMVAIWRAAVYLLFHCGYSYRCTLCNARSFTSNGRSRRFDRQYAICPACNQTFVRVGEHMVVGALHYDHRTGYAIIDGDGAVLCQSRRRSELDEAVCSPIEVTRLASKIDNPYQILNDPDQCAKWFSTWVWNSLRQILNENKIKRCDRHVVTQCHQAHQAAAIELAHCLGKLKCDCHIDHVDSGTSEVVAQLLTTPVGGTYGLLDLSHRASVSKTALLPILSLIVKYGQCGVSANVTPGGVRFTADPDEVPTVEISIVEDRPVQVLSISTSPGNDDGERNRWADAVEFASGMAVMDPMDATEEADLFAAMKSRLPYKAQIMLDLLAQRGPAWDDYLMRFGKHTKSNAMSYLEITKGEYKSFIKLIAEVYREVTTPVTIDAVAGDIIIVTQCDNSIWCHTTWECERLKHQCGTGHFSWALDSIVSISGRTIVLREHGEAVACECMVAEGEC